MNVKEVVIKFSRALERQEFNFEQKLFEEAFDSNYDYLTGTKKKVYSALHSINQSLVNYKSVDAKKFEADLNKFQQMTDPSMLFAWKYVFGSLFILGTIYADNLSDSDILALFNNFDKGITNVMRGNVAELSGSTKASILGTMVLLFSDPNKANRIANQINKYYNSHFWKYSYVSTFIIDCSSETLVQGKWNFGRKWTGGLEIPMLRKDLFE